MKPKSRASRWPDAVLVVAVGLAAVLGLAVLAGWRTRTASLAQPVAGLVSMMGSTLDVEIGRRPRGALEDVVLGRTAARGYPVARLDGEEEVYRRGDAGAQVHLDEVLLLLGLAVALLLPWTVYLARAARRRAAEAETARQTLEREQAHFRSLIEYALDIITVLDGDGTIRFESPSVERVLGYEPEELIGRSIFEFVHPDDASSVIEAFTDAIQRPGIAPRMEFRFRHKDGSWRSLEAIGSNLLAESGVAGVVVNSRDVTERRQADEALEALRRQHELILNSAGEGIFGVDVEGNFTFVNPAAARILGWEVNELIGRPKHALVHHTRPDGTPYAREACPMYAALKEGIVRGGDDEIFWRKDGTSFPVSYTSTPIRERGEIVGKVVTFQDITERKRLEEQFRQAQKMEAVGRLAGGIAHDFNNLLTAIRGYSELLLEERQPDERLARDVCEIRKAAEQATSLTRRLLAFSRRQVLQPRVLSLNAVVTEVEKMLRRLIGEDVEFVTALDPALGCVKADPGQLEQVLVNLAVNARDAMPKGGRLTLETANAELDQTYARRHVSARPGSYVMLAVSDTGCGMDAETRSRVFEPFFTTKEVGKGTGLGLSMVYGIVKQSGGYIWVYSEPGLGTTFKVYLRRVEEPAETAVPDSPPAAPTGGSETILLVEDDDGVRTLAREILGRAGYTVLEARDGNEALAIGERHDGPIALMLTDIVMPGRRGKEVARHLVAVRPDTKILYMSGYTDNAIGNRGVLDRGTAFLSKPFTPGVLLRKVREVLDPPCQGAAPPGARA